MFRSFTGLAMALTTAASAAAGFDSFTSAMPAASSMMGAGGMSEGAKTQAMQDMQDKCVAYAKDQGFTVTTP